MNDLDRVRVLTEEIEVLRNRFEPNSGMGNINTAISVMEKRVEELAQKIRDDSKDGQIRGH
jgi:hypothetical protein|tara:strand:+ start:168 stop:350 length:183 start_codon:yes stop_codon:yes gene_type:complete